MEVVEQLAVNMVVGSEAHKEDVVTISTDEEQCKWGLAIYLLFFFKILVCMNDQNCLLLLQ